MENKFKRLTSSKSLQNSSRFENVLMTSRRSPVIPGRGASTNLRLGSVISSHLAPKSSFFRRHYSTSFPKSSNSKLIAGRIFKLQRQNYEQISSLPAYKALSLRYALKSRVYAKSHSKYTESSSDLAQGSTDPRFLRMKSPRNRQFIQRLSSQYKNKNLTLYREYLKTSLTSSYRSNKLQFTNRKGLVPIAKSFVLANSTTLQKLRNRFVTRRPATFLKTRLFDPNFTQLARKRFIFASKTRARNYSALYDKKFIAERKVLNFLSIKANRSILQFRKASLRLSPVLFSKSFIVYPSAAVLRPVVSKFLSYHATGTSITKKILK